MSADSEEPEAADRVESIHPTWVPREMDQWCAPGGALHGVPTLAELCESGPHVCADHLGMDAAVSARAAQLAGLGAGPARVVAWQMPNTAEAVVLYRACFTIGAVAAPLHHMAGDAEVTALVERLQPVVFVTSDGTPAHSPADAGGADTEGPAPCDVAVVLHTSGSSGAPKGVMHTHRGLAHKALTMVQVHGLGPTDAVLMPAPLAHVSGLLNGVLVPAAAGMRSVLMQRWDPEEALDPVSYTHLTLPTKIV